ncbi:YihY/virulence factor BrkB family protein [Streptomyces fradiae]|uniref:YihY/virulence factor BrkB family protein n=1 Tax=Streptomyces fradiae TaxID=1906 RepID=UPI0029420BBF|nr:YhjD/YihY/BrkB family envelope integrity protein [Streptomyces fradiae]WOI62816.1 YhjD/YihY/BrkB family envelope integrity protein [Streptomyces fradiae]
MDWLTKLPVIGPWAARLTRTHAWYAYETLDRVHWARLAAAITFISFLSLFPLITLGAAIGAALVGDERLRTAQDKISEQVPGISDQLDLGSLVENAGTVGLVAGAVLLFTGIGWVGSLRECLRAVWGLDGADDGNPVVRKGKDALLLLGLGGTALVSLAASTLGATAVGWGADRLGVPEGGAGGVLLQAAALLVAVVADFLLLLYLLTLLPGVEPPRRDLVAAALIGAVGFELLKLLLGGYMRGVAGKSMYGAFGVPVALLLWISFTARLLLFCAAWTATGDRREAAEDTTEDTTEDAAGGPPGDSPSSAGPHPAPGSPAAGRSAAGSPAPGSPAAGRPATGPSAPATAD